MYSILDNIRETLDVLQKRRNCVKLMVANNDYSLLKDEQEIINQYSHHLSSLLAKLCEKHGDIALDAERIEAMYFAMRKVYRTSEKNLEVLND